MLFWSKYKQNKVRIFGGEINMNTERYTVRMTKLFFLLQLASTGGKHKKLNCLVVYPLVCHVFYVENSFFKLPTAST